MKSKAINKSMSAIGTAVLYIAMKHLTRTGSDFAFMWTLHWQFM